MKLPHEMRIWEKHQARLCKMIEMCATKGRNDRLIASVDNELVSFICMQALDSPIIFSSHDLRYLRVNTIDRIILTQKQVLLIPLT